MLLACIQTVFLGKSFIIGKQSPLVQIPKDMREHRKKMCVRVCIDEKEEGRTEEKTGKKRE